MEFWVSWLRGHYFWKPKRHGSHFKTFLGPIRLLPKIHIRTHVTMHPEVHKKYNCHDSFKIILYLLRDGWTFLCIYVFVYAYMHIDYV